MILYHFTCLEHLPSILEHGLNRGEAPLSATTWDNAVNLTLSATAEGIGLSPVTMTADDMAKLGLSRDSYFPDKTRVRIKVIVNSNDRSLVAWRKWSAKQRRSGLADGALLDALERGQSPRKWFLYFDTISPDRFVEVLDMQTGKPAAERELLA